MPTFFGRWVSSRRAGGVGALPTGSEGFSWSSFRRGIVFSLGFALMGLGGGCALVESHYTLNPDGQGKVSVEAVERILSMSENGEGGGVSENALWSKVEDFMEKTEGIEVWADVSYELIELEDDAFFVFRGTGYFRDLNAVKFKGVNEIFHPRLELENDIWQLALLPFGDEGEMQVNEETEPASGGEEDPLVAELEQRADQRGLRLFQAMLEETKHKMTFTLPQGPLQSSGFEEVEANVLQMSFDGAELARKIDHLKDKSGEDAEDALLSFLQKQSPHSPEESLAILQEYLKDTLEPKASWESGGTSHFDYEAEVEAAKSNFPAMMEALRP
ncbi:MAG: hypothetical protein LAT58_01630 [Opitutales bacterium]|nr:hypothetical protein [Opitutales bacterium]